MHSPSFGRDFCDSVPETEFINYNEVTHSFILSLILPLAFIPSLRKNPNDYIPSHILIVLDPIRIPKNVNNILLYMIYSLYSGCVPEYFQST